jgi:hypothetical protein
MTKRKLSIEEKSLFRYANHFDDGRIIKKASGLKKGKGYASYPWALDENEKSLGLSPKESWLMKRLLKHHWLLGGVVYPSISKIAETSCVTRQTIHRYLKSLKEKGYLHTIGRFPGKMQAPMVYSVVGLYNALTFAIINDEKSPFQCLPENKKEKAIDKLTAIIDMLPIEITNSKTPIEINEYFNKKKEVFDWGTFEIHDIDEKKRKFEMTCVLCGKGFNSSSQLAMYCEACQIENMEKHSEEFFINSSSEIIDTPKQNDYIYS